MENKTCPHIQLCVECQMHLCQHCIFDCSGCGKEFCEGCYTAHMTTCTECKNMICPSDRMETICCGIVLCPSCEVGHAHSENPIEQIVDEVFTEIDPNRVKLGMNTQEEKTNAMG